MGIYKRATQFTPFAALRGYYEEILRREERLARVDKIELMEDSAELLDRALHRLALGQDVEIVYFADGTYRLLRGLFSGIDSVRRTIKIVKTEIPLDALLQVRHTESE